MNKCIQQLPDDDDDKILIFAGANSWKRNPHNLAESLSSSTDVGKSCTCHIILQVKNMSFNVIWGNKILTKISEFTV